AARFSVPDEQQQSAEHKRRILHLVVTGEPRHGTDKRRMCDPKDCSGDRSRLRAGETRRQATYQQHINRDGQKNGNSKRNSVEAKKIFEQKKESALAPRANCSLGGRPEQRVDQISESVNALQKSKPGEIGLAEPDMKRARVQPHEKQNRNQ